MLPLAVRHPHHCRHQVCTPPPSPPSTSLDAVAAQEGSRVLIDGLQAAPEMNGRTGVICGAFDIDSGRWTVEIYPVGTLPACRGTFRPANLRLIPPHNFGTEWLDEFGQVWPKNVDFSRRCAKGHALSQRDACDERGRGRLMCRLCHCFSQGDSDDAACWLMCSVDANCCGAYAVCHNCARAPAAAAAAPTVSGDNINTLVSRCMQHCEPQCMRYIPDAWPLQGVGLSYLSWLRSSLGQSLGRITTSQFCQMYVRPFTSHSRGSVTERLMELDDTSQHVGQATWFVSHTWSNAFLDTLDAILLFFKGRNDAASAKMWFDVMVTSQHASAGPSKPSSWWMGTFKSSIARIGGLLLVVDVWDNPTALRRAW